MKATPERVTSTLSDSARRKRLGQFFTGLPLARLLANLSRPGAAFTAIDPFAGSGDMLVAAKTVDHAQILAGVELDPTAIAVARSRLSDLSPEAHLISGDAFNPATLRRLPRTSFDLVITNPPYVRYQSLAHARTLGAPVPDAVRVRTGLIEMLAAPDLFPHLDDTDRGLLARLAAGYSGLADLAVPAWLLSACLTNIGGRLAMVVPESWLSRDYAQAVHYLLLRWFRIRHVVEDAHACWFADAQVRTTLLVADRIERRPTAFGWTAETFLRTSVSSAACSPGSVIAKAFPEAAEPEADFTEALEAAAQAETSVATPMWQAHRIPLAEKAANLRALGGADAWLSFVEPSAPDATECTPQATCFLPDPIRRWLGADHARDFVTLAELGFEVGQGLRTGANDFFYVEMKSETAKRAHVEASVTTRGTLSVPSDCVLPVVRRQEEAGSLFVLRRDELIGRVLMLHGHALAEDLDALADDSIPPVVWRAARRAYRRMPEVLARHVRATGKGPIPKMSAVRTNARQGKVAKDGETVTLPRWWYMLPRLAPRHRPDLLIARINNRTPRTILNPGRDIVVDANFSSLWERAGGGRATAMLALLNSSWCTANMECSAAVMGGGALKLEAAHISRLPMPRLEVKDWARLTSLGRRLAAAKDIERTLKEIDEVVTRLVIKDATPETVCRLIQIREVQQDKRCRKT